jgi:lactate permease
MGVAERVPHFWRIVGLALVALYVILGVVDWKFSLALLPLIIVLVGMVVFRLSGAVMAVVGWVLAMALAVGAFHTDWRVALLGSAEGLLKSLGIGVAVVFTMYLIFFMKEAGLLEVVSASLKRIARTKEDQALFIGIGFGTFATSLGIVTPALFPPLLMALGFGPFGAVAIAVLGYNASTSFALLSIPITLPADVSPGLTNDVGFVAIDFAYKISIYLPVIAIAISFAMLYVVGGRESVKRGAVQAFIVGAAVGTSCLGFVSYEAFTGNTFVPLRIVGVVAGLISMVALYAYMAWSHRWRKKNSPASDSLETKTDGGEPISADEEGAVGEGSSAQDEEPPLDRRKVLWAYSPLIILTLLAAFVGIQSVADRLSDIPGEFEQVHLFSNPGMFVDLDVLSQVYTWILIAVLISIAFIRPSKEVLTRTTTVWFRRIWSPFVAYSVYFAIAYVMAYSAMELGGVSGWRLVPSEHFDDFNMNGVLAAGLAAAFGTGYLWIASSLGLFGAIVGGSETGSNVLFMKIQYSTATSAEVGLSDSQFLTMFGGHGAAGGVASAITPSKINNAVATIGEGPELEAEVMRKLLVITIVLTIIINVMTGIFVSLNV